MKNATLISVPFLISPFRKVDAKKSIMPGLTDRIEQPSGNDPYFNVLFALFNLAFLLALFLLLPAVGNVSSYPTVVANSVPADHAGSPDPDFSPLSDYFSKQSVAARMANPIRGWTWTKQAGNKQKSFGIKMNLPIYPFN